MNVCNVPWRWLFIAVAVEGSVSCPIDIPRNLIGGESVVLGNETKPACALHPECGGYSIVYGKVCTSGERRVDLTLGPANDKSGRLQRSCKARRFPQKFAIDKSRLYDVPNNEITGKETIFEFGLSARSVAEGAGVYTSILAELNRL